MMQDCYLRPYNIMRYNGRVMAFSQTIGEELNQVKLVIRDFLLKDNTDCSILTGIIRHLIAITLKQDCECVISHC